MLPRYFLKLVLSHLPETSRIWAGGTSLTLDSARRLQVLKPEMRTMAISGPLQSGMAGETLPPHP